MVDVKIKSRPIGAQTALRRNGHPVVTSRTGGQVTVVTGASEEGFNPLDLMFASLSACLALSARIAASRLGILDRFESVVVDVTGRKTAEEPYRIEQFFVAIKIEGHFSEAQRLEIVEMAERICTVSNTLHTPPVISIDID